MSTQEIASEVTDSFCVITGRATFTTLASKVTMNAMNTTLIRMSFLFPYAFSASTVFPVFIR